MEYWEQRQTGDLTRKYDKFSKQLESIKKYVSLVMGNSPPFTLLKLQAVYSDSSAWNYREKGAMN